MITLKLENLIAQKAAVVAEMRAILDRADAEGDRDVTPVEESAYNTLQTRLEKVEKAIERETMLSEKEAKMNEPRKKCTPAPIMAGQRVGLRSGEVGLHYEDLFGNGNMGPFKDAEHFYTSVITNQLPAESRTMLADVATQGGYTVPTELARDIYNAVLDTSVCLPYVRTFRMGTGTLQIPAWYSETRSEGGIVAFEGSWIAEEGTATPVTPRLRLVELHAHKLSVFVNISRECISDSLTLGQQLGPTMVQSLAYTLDAVIKEEHARLYALQAVQPVRVAGD